MHGRHASVIDPDERADARVERATARPATAAIPARRRAACAARWATAVAADGSLAMQCQSCHGTMSRGRRGDAAGLARGAGLPELPHRHGDAQQRPDPLHRPPSSQRPRRAWPSTRRSRPRPNTPAAGFSLYRFSTGHGGLQCAACHGSTHAEYPSVAPQRQPAEHEAAGPRRDDLAECTACHGSVAADDQRRARTACTRSARRGSTSHGDAAEQQRPRRSARPATAPTTAAPCCRGRCRPDADRRVRHARTFFRGAQVGCYICHNGPSSESRNSNRPAVASDLAASSTGGAPAIVPLVATDPDGNALTLRIVSQPSNGTVSLSGTTATYFPFAGFSGSDAFTYAAWDGSIDSNLATVTVNVGPPCALSSTTTVPLTATIGASVPFSTTVTGCSGAITYDWTFGDGSAHATIRNPTHAYAAAGTYQWAMTASAGGQTTSETGTIIVAPACSLTSTASVPPTATVGVGVPFSVTVAAQSCAGTIAYNWDFGDGSAHATTRTPTHAYSSAGSFQWAVTASAGGQTTSQAGDITVAPAPQSAPTVSRVRRAVGAVPTPHRRHSLRQWREGVHRHGHGALVWRPVRLVHTDRPEWEWAVEPVPAASDGQYPDRQP